MSGPEIIVSIEAGPWADKIAGIEERCQRVAAIALSTGAALCEDLPLERAELSLVLADDSMVRTLNGQYRGQDKPTNVLSFAALDDEDAPETEDGPLLLGDVIIAYETTAAEAEAEGKTLSDHLSHLVIHGVLHLLGFDHMEEDEAQEMEGLESSILGMLGIADPYRTDEAS
ncbi:MAG TPA: rRNA maturation RNase YbeY [Candidatus Sulfotelmatobacter sp.]|jgi:probable rRNA maturation factor|nr:rRNA maturation RNase YbeY [Candidatus Sulfotelmatobacter sp.]